MGSFARIIDNHVKPLSLSMQSGKSVTLVSVFSSAPPTPTPHPRPTPPSPIISCCSRFVVVVVVVDDDDDNFSILLLLLPLLLLQGFVVPFGCVVIISRTGCRKGFRALTFILA